MRSAQRNKLRAEIADLKDLKADLASSVKRRKLAGTPATEEANKEIIQTEFQRRLKAEGLETTVTPEVLDTLGIKADGRFAASPQKI